MIKKIISALITIMLAVEALPIMVSAKGQENLFINGDFEELLSVGGWGSRHTARYARVTENPQNGEYCAVITPELSTTTWLHDMRLTPGETYSFSMWARTEKGFGEIDFRCYFNYGYAHDAWNDKTKQIAYFTQKVGEKWTQIKHTFTYTGKNAEGVDVDDNVQFGFRISRAGEKPKVYIDNFTLIPEGKTEQESERMPETFEWKEDPLPKAKEIASKDFADTENHWAETTIDVLSGEGVINGVSDTEFAPERSVTRAEFITLLTNNFNIMRLKNASKPLKSYGR